VIGSDPATSARNWQSSGNNCRCTGPCSGYWRHDDVTMKRVVITTGVLAIVGGAATILLMPSCDPDCEVQPKPSVILQIVAKQPKAVANDLVAEDVWYEHTNADGETTTKQAECMDDECTEWMLGDGSPGTYEYHATVCGHQYDASVTLEYNDDGCEVDTQMIELPVDSCADALAPEPPRPPQSGEPELGITQKTCTLEARPSVLVSVMGQVDSHLVPLPADRVFYEVHRPGEPSTGQMPGVCLNETCSMFAAGFEQTGSFEVGAEVCGEVITAKVRVDKTSNGCHVNTQQIQEPTCRDHHSPGGVRRTGKGALRLRVPGHRRRRRLDAIPDREPVLRARGHAALSLLRRNCRQRQV
jgi:hypothetical protein